MIAMNMTCYNRPSYLRTTLSSLMKSNIPEDTYLYITDDCSSNLETLDILNSIKSVGKLTVNINRRKNHVGITKNVLDGLKHCFDKSGSDFVIALNSDCVFNPSWLVKLLDAKIKLADRNIGAITAFNMQYTGDKVKQDYNHTIITTLSNGIRVKDSCSGFCTMINRDVFSTLGNIKDHWDCRYVDRCRTMKYGIFCTDKSYVQHIGIDGIHTRSNNEIDVAIDFVGV